MIIIFIFIGLIILGFGMYQIYKHTNHKIFGSDVFGFTGMAIGVVAGIITLILILFAIIENSLPYQKQWTEKRANLQVRCDANAPNDVMLWSEVGKFNYDLKMAQYWHKNKWTSWLNEGDCMEIEPIEPIPIDEPEITYPDDFIGPRPYRFEEQ